MYKKANKVREQDISESSRQEYDKTSNVNLNYYKFCYRNLVAEAASETKKNAKSIAALFLLSVFYFLFRNFILELRLGENCWNIISK